MRKLMSFAAAGLAIGLLSAAPAKAFDDTLPSYAPYPHRTHVVYGHHHRRAKSRSYRHRHAKLARRPVLVRVVHGCRRWTWREHCYPYKLNGYFERRPDFRLYSWYR